jgi:diguanylate cyclase (GGDEF)-like protein
MTDGREGGEPGVVTAEIALQIHALEADALASGIQNACLEALGRCETRVFAFNSEGSRRLSVLGAEDDTRTFDVPDLGSGGVFGEAVKPLDATPDDKRRRWCSLIPLQVGNEVWGVLQVVSDRGLSVETLQQLARPVSVAVKNAAVFERTKRLTFTDDLTTRHNARFMSLYLDRELKRCRRAKSSLCLLFMDLDGFKAVNDTHGHLAGSRTLVEVGEALERTVREADVLIRYGGDEFVILFPETPLSGGLVIAERLRTVIADTVFLESMGLRARVSASIGLAAYPESAEDVRGLIASADRAMYEAKALGKNRVVQASPLPSTESTPRGPSH